MSFPCHFDIYRIVGQFQEGFRPCAVRPGKVAVALEALRMHPQGNAGRGADGEFQHALGYVWLQRPRRRHHADGESL